MSNMHINVLKYVVYVLYGCGKQFELDGSLNHAVILSFHSTSDSDPQNLSHDGWVQPH